MSLHDWTNDAPTGTYKNHKLSSKIRMAAIADTKLMQFVRAEPNYGKKAGEVITITRVSNIAVPTSAALTEGVRIPEDEVSLSTQGITVGEFGRAIPYTNLAVDLAHFNLLNPIQPAGS